MLSAHISSQETATMRVAFTHEVPSFDREPERSGDVAPGFNVAQSVYPFPECQEDHRPRDKTEARRRD